MKKKYLIIGIVIALGLSLFGVYQYIEIKKDEERQIAEAEEQNEKLYDSLYDKYNTGLLYAKYTIPEETSTKNYEKMLSFEKKIQNKSMSKDEIKEFESIYKKIDDDYKKACLWVQNFEDSLKSKDLKTDADTQEKIDFCWGCYNSANGDMKIANAALTSIQKMYTDYESRLAQEKLENEKAQAENANSSEQEDSAYIDIANICQNPELPTGCECVSATIVLNYYGAGMGKTELVDRYLTYSEDPYQGFCGGSPYDQPDGSDLQWVAPGPVVNAMNQALSERGMNYTAVDITGTDFDTLLSYVDNGQPVLFWGLENMRYGDHTLVLMGYDRNKNICYFADPMKNGIQSYDINKSRDAYNSRGKMSAVVR